MKVGACGIACETCGLYTKGICEGCEHSQGHVEFLKRGLREKVNFIPFLQFFTIITILLFHLNSFLKKSVLHQDNLLKLNKELRIL